MLAIQDDFRGTVVRRAGFRIADLRIADLSIADFRIKDVGIVEPPGDAFAKQNLQNK